MSEILCEPVCESEGERGSVQEAARVSVCTTQCMRVHVRVRLLCVCVCALVFVFVCDSSSSCQRSRGRGPFDARPGRAAGSPRTFPCGAPEGHTAHNLC